jgi:GDPmannose 4,6-dehydratase
VDAAAKVLGMELRWSGEGIDERAVDASGKTVVRVDPRYFRPAEVDSLLGDASKARAKLGWKPEISFSQLVREMALADLEEARREASSPANRSTRSGGE